MSQEKTVWDVIVVGGGPAGLSAATVLARSRRKVLVIDEGKQRNLKSHGLHNFITRDGILPPDFLRITREELEHYPVKIIVGRVERARTGAVNFELEDHEGTTHHCRKVLVATGVCDNIPDVPGMKELWGASVFHCPFCDGYECKDSTVGLYATKHNGYGMALALRHLTSNVILFTDGSYYLKQVQRQQLAAKGIKVVTRKIAKLAERDGKLNTVVLADGREIACDSMFTHHGYRVNDSLLKQLGCKCSSKGPAITNRKQQTSVKGVYVAGDASFDMHFAVVAAAEGVKAGVSIHNDLLQEDNKEALAVKDA